MKSRLLLLAALAAGTLSFAAVRANDEAVEQQVEQLEEDARTLTEDEKEDLTRALELAEAVIKELAIDEDGEEAKDREEGEPSDA